MPVASSLEATGIRVNAPGDRDHGRSGSACL